jgi:hypothetical protein
MRRQLDLCIRHSGLVLKWLSGVDGTGPATISILEENTIQPPMFGQVQLQQTRLLLEACTLQFGQVPK